MLSRAQGHSAAGQCKNVRDPNGYRASNIPACSSVPKLPRTPNTIMQVTMICSLLRFTTTKVWTEVFSMRCLHDVRTICQVFHVSTQVFSLFVLLVYYQHGGSGFRQTTSLCCCSISTTCCHSDAICFMSC